MNLRTTYIPFHEWQGVGGPYTFMENLKRELARRHVSLCPTFQDCGQMLFPISYDPDKLHWGKVRGKRIVVRLDGIWYPQKHGEDYRRLNQPVKDIYLYYADHVIFQSDYSRRQCFEIFGELPESRYTIIINGADKSLFYPAERGEERDQLQFITTGNFRNAAMIEPLTVALDQLASERTFKLHVVGPVTDDLRCWLERPYIVDHKTKTTSETAELLRQSDIFLYSHLNPPCPNSVIEAVSCGLPVVGFDSGAMKELLPWAPELLAEVSDEVFQTYESFDSERLMHCIGRAVAELPKYRQLASEQADRYPFTKCADAYLEVLQRPSVNAAKRSGVAAKVYSAPGRFLTKACKRLRLDEKMRSIAVELLSGMKRQEFVSFMMRVLDRRIEQSAPADALRTMFELDKILYKREGEQAIAYEGGVHSKHRHLQYHRFFTSNVNATDRVLDLGCGKGELANSLTEVVTEGRIYGLDRRESSIQYAREHFGHKQNLQFVLGDINDGLPGNGFDVVVLSNVLEHIEHRVKLLTDIRELFSPDRVLIRVPMYQREWRVPLQDELGFDYRLDPEHFIEFTPESFLEETSEAGYAIIHQEIRWGEIWAVIRPADQVTT